MYSIRGQTMKITVASVVYEEALRFGDDFIVSLQKQDCQEFDVLLINDNIPMDFLADRVKTNHMPLADRIHIVDKSKHGLLPFALRIELLLEALKHGTELLILLDFDDIAKSNRVSEIVRQHDEKYDFYYNDIFLFNGMNAMPQLPKVTDDIRNLLEQNYLGLSNSAINLRHIKKEFIESLREGKTQIFDWYLFSRMLLSGMTGKYIDNTGTYYRIYENNIAGIPNDTLNELEKEKQIKLKHYDLLQKYDSRYKKLIEIYENLNLSERRIGAEKKGYYWWGMISEWRDE